MSEKFRVRQIPTTTSVIDHNVRFACNERMFRHIAKMPLVQSVQAQEVRAGGGRGGRAFCSPRERGAVVASEPDGAFGDRG